MEATFTNTGRHDQFLAGQNRLTELATAGQLSRAVLDEAMQAMYDDGDYIDRSIGFAWLTEQTTLFAETAVRCGFPVDAFLLEHGSVCWVGCRILLYGQVLELVPAERREQFVRETYMRFGAFNNSWVDVVTKVGVPLSTVVELIAAKLETVSDDCERSNICNAVWDFLGDHGSACAGDTHWSLFDDAQFSETVGRFAERQPALFFAHRGFLEGRMGKARYEELAARVESRRDEPTARYAWHFEPTMWAALNDGQFRRAIGICARKSPTRFFEMRAQIEERLGKEVFNTLGILALAREAGLRAGGLSAAQRKFVEEQPLDFQVQVARSLTAGADFLIGVMLKLGAGAGAELYREKGSVFDAAHIATLYRSTWSLRHQNGQPRQVWLERELERRLTDGGYIIGTVQESTFTPRGGRPQRQWQVIHNGITYVKERNQRGYYSPKAGDRVIINLNGGHRLTPRVVAVMFLPAHSGEEIRAY